MTMDRQRCLLGLLADGAVHSGADLAGRLGVSRTAIWQYTRVMAERGVTIEAVRGRGYRLINPIELLDAGTIRSALSPAVRKRLVHLDVHFETDSTSQRLVERAALADVDVHGHACLAEIQTAGRGRRGRRWFGGIGSGICLSVAWRFNSALEALAGLSLATGISVHSALQATGVGGGLTLKWPNDVLFEGRKLAGILVEVSGETGGPCLAVIGIGVNVFIPPELHAEIGQPATDLHKALGCLPSRNQLSAALLGELLNTLPEFETKGFAAFSGAWAARDGVRGQRVKLTLPSGAVSGVSEGVDAEGALLLRTGGNVRRFHTGEVSVRLAQ